MDQLVQVLGSLLILAAYVAAQRGSLPTGSRRYLFLNLVGATVLAVLAAHERQLGFLLLEFVWALVAAQALLSRRAGRASGPRPAGGSPAGGGPARGRSRAPRSARAAPGARP